MRRTHKVVESSTLFFFLPSRSFTDSFIRERDELFIHDVLLLTNYFTTFPFPSSCLFDYRHVDQRAAELTLKWVRMLKKFYFKIFLTWRRRDMKFGEKVNWANFQVKNEAELTCRTNMSLSAFPLKVLEVFVCVVWCDVMCCPAVPLCSHAGQE